MQIIYPLTVQADYTELKYSLRSVEKFLDMRVVIVGALPDWITNVTHLNIPDIRGKKQLSIRSKILAALDKYEEILFMNDDIFLLNKPDLKYYYHGYLKKYSEPGARQVEKQLEKIGKPTKHFDGHMPIIYKQDFKEVSKHFREDCIIKSMYCNYLGIEGEFAPDCKILTHGSQRDIFNFIKEKPCFSTGIYSLKSCLPILERLFTEKSKFEK